MTWHKQNMKVTRTPGSAFAPALPYGSAPYTATFSLTKNAKTYFQSLPQRPSEADSTRPRPPNLGDTCH